MKISWTIWSAFYKKSLRIHQTLFVQLSASVNVSMITNDKIDVDASKTAEGDKTLWFDQHFPDKSFSFL